ncbi:MAG: hypothetical protein LBL97_06750 [Prevotellaceae bacterium]|jgi:hypothetical protein|nr:hypothetical protein [Prevotellaceae bacterium]
MDTSLVFQTHPKVEIAGNTFINVPVILQYEDVNLIEVVHDMEIGYTSRIPIYHPDGTKLAVATGNRLYPTNEGKNTNLQIDKYEGVWVCKLDNRELFEIHQQTGDAFKTIAELYTQDGFFIKIPDQPFLNLFNAEKLQIDKFTMMGNTFIGGSVGIRIKNRCISLGG